MAQQPTLYNYFDDHSVIDHIAQAKQHYSQSPGNPAPSPILPLGNLLDRGESLPDEPAHDYAAGPKGRRSEDEMARSNHEQGAVKLTFTPHLLATDEEGDFIHKMSASYLSKGAHEYRLMENKGFFVTRDGCIFPDKLYREHAKGKTVKGYQRMAYYQTGLCVNKGSVDTRPARNKVKDRNGWPVDSQLSHLCHRRGCVRPDHIIYELTVVNRRRNYCGITQSHIDSTQTTVGSQSNSAIDCGVHCSEWDGCDCGMVPKCCRPYHPAEWFDLSQADLASTESDVKHALRDLLPEEYPWVLESAWPPDAPSKKRKKSKSSKGSTEAGTSSGTVQKKASRKEGKSKYQPGKKNKDKYNSALRRLPGDFGDFEPPKL